MFAQKVHFRTPSLGKNLNFFIFFINRPKNRQNYSFAQLPILPRFTIDPPSFLLRLHLPKEKGKNKDFHLDLRINLNINFPVCSWRAL